SPILYKDSFIPLCASMPCVISTRTSALSQSELAEINGFVGAVLSIRNAPDLPSKLVLPALPQRANNRSRSCLAESQSNSRHRMPSNRHQASSLTSTRHIQGS